MKYPEKGYGASWDHGAAFWGSVADPHAAWAAGGGAHGAAVAASAAASTGTAIPVKKKSQKGPGKRTAKQEINPNTIPAPPVIPKTSPSDEAVAVNTSEKKFVLAIVMI